MAARLCGGLVLVFGGLYLLAFLLYLVGTFGLANVNSCAIEIMRGFVIDPGAPLDLTCASEWQTLPFMQPDFTMP